MGARARKPHQHDEGPDQVGLAPSFCFSLSNRRKRALVFLNAL